MTATIRFAPSSGIASRRDAGARSHSRSSGNDRFAGSFAVDTVGRYRFEIESWVDRHAGWLDEHDRKIAAGQEDLAGELAEGAALFGDGHGRGLAGGG